MRTGELTVGAARLHKSWQKLRAHWEQTKLEWRDTVAQDFERRYLNEIEPELKTTLERMRILADVLATAHRDCDQ
ncbi:MAG: hypothetical protein DWQ37_14755 [Planctomycetota bacterium]|nr:MAG: hypothetical protein DWQ37_14755 [Planctomycetota bacterium]